MNSNGHVARLMEGRRHSPHGVTQVHCPQQEEEFSCEERMRKKCRLATQAQAQKSVLYTKEATRAKNRMCTHQPVTSQFSDADANSRTTRVYRKISCSTDPTTLICNSCGCILWEINESPMHLHGNSMRCFLGTQLHSNKHAAFSMKTCCHYLDIHGVVCLNSGEV